MFAPVRLSLYSMRDLDSTVKHRRNPDNPLNQDPDKLRRHRVAAGLSITALAGRLGKSKGHMSEIENRDRTRSASPELLAAIAAELGCAVIDLMPDADAA
jgi:hypothetical protein